MKPWSRRRRLIPSRVEYGTPTAGGCSVCRRPFEVQIGTHEALSEANERLMAAFQAHICDEDANQAAARTVRVVTDKS